MGRLYKKKKTTHTHKKKQQFSYWTIKTTPSQWQRDLKSAKAKSKFMQHPSLMFHCFILSIARWTHWTATRKPSLFHAHFVPCIKCRLSHRKALPIKIIIYDLSEPFWSLEIGRLKHIMPFRHLLYGLAHRNGCVSAHTCVRDLT